MADEIANLLNNLDNEPVQKTVTKVYSKKVLSNDSVNKLLPYQIQHVLNLMQILVTHRIALDASDTGIGKTYSAAAICKELERRPLIVCPKTLIYNWERVLKLFGVKAYDIVNYETFKNGKTYANNLYKTRVKSPFLDVIDPADDDRNKIIHEWHLPKNAIVIFDEVHKCKGKNTANGKLLMSTKQLINNNIPVLLLSATICEKYDDVKILFYLISKIGNLRGYLAYIRELVTKPEYKKFKPNRKDYATSAELKIAKENAISMIIYEEIKDYVSRIRIKDLGDKFPKNQWFAQQFIAKESDEISEAYHNIALLMRELRNNPGGNHLAQIQKLKQEIEFRKVPIFIEQAKLYLDEHKSVIIFVNYLDTLNVLSKELNIICKIYGDQTMDERQEAIDKFQSNEEPIIICQMRAGGVGISLHDLDGNHPRVTLINYPDSASDLLQALGRAPRAGAMSPVLQRIIFVANVPYEKKIMQNINRKLTNISAINDGDLDGYKHKVARVERVKKVATKTKTEDAELADEIVIVKQKKL